jgi:spermidine synthase
MKAWKTLASVATGEGNLELRQRGESDFLIVIDGRVLMTSAERRSEEALATLALGKLPAASHVLIGGLGMGYTLRAALDVLPASARVTVAELNPAVVDWCKGPLAILTANAAADPRVTIAIDDVARVIARGTYSAILIDLYEGPNPATQDKDDPFYGRTALARTHAALVPGGVFAVWSEEADDTFVKRFIATGFTVSTHRLGSSRRHFVYLGLKS